MKGTDSQFENYETSITSGQLTNGLTDEDVTHCFYSGLPLTTPPQKPLLSRDSDIAAMEQWVLDRSRRFSRSRARPLSKIVPQALSITQGLDRREWKALRREEKLVGRNAARERFNGGKYGEHMVGERTKSRIQSRVSMKRVGGKLIISSNTIVL
jgi:hypothetical protein